MKKFALAIAAVTTVAALSAAPASAENVGAEQQAKLAKLFNKKQATAPRVQTRATTFTSKKAVPLSGPEAAAYRLFKNRPPRGR